jgi:ATP-dependent DNA ligase
MTNHWQRWKGIMKAYPFEEKRLAKWEPPYIVQPKFDGIRCRAVPIERGNYLLLSSEENIVYSVPHIVAVLDHSRNLHELDGELYSHELFLEGGHELISSITSRTVNIHPRHKEMQFHIFDFKSPESQGNRTCALENLGIRSPLVLSPYWICESLDDVKRTYDSVIKLGYEGIIIRHILAPYEEKRSTWVMKFKPKKKDKYTIVGWNEEISKDGLPKGRIGSLIMSSQEGDNFGVSAGLDAEEKTRLWNIRDELAGKRAIVHYQHLTNKKIPKGTFNVEVL